MIYDKLDRCAVLIDTENVFFAYTDDRSDFPNLLRIFLWEITCLLKRERIKPVPEYCRLYLQRQPHTMSKDWHRECVEASREHGFTLYWSEPRQPAEEVMDRHILEITERANFPNETFVISGDGDLIPSMDVLLRWHGCARRGAVCALSWRYQMNAHIRKVVTGTVCLNDIAPKTLKMLENLRGIETRKVSQHSSVS